MQSHWDHLVHVFRELTDVASTALCTHSAMTSLLTEPPPDARWCPVCRGIHDAWQAASGDDPGHWSPQ
jgi:hypothetical protein